MPNDILNRHRKRTNSNVLDLATPSTQGSLSGLKYTGVGGKGSYQQVVSMPPGEWPSCNVNPSCVKQTKTVSGNLAPFNDDQSVVFEGPMTLYNIAVYQPAQPDETSAWSLVSSWEPNTAPNNLVFMNNMGGGASGTWSICQGASQSFSNGSFTGTVANQNEQLYSGVIPATFEVNIMSGESCTSGTCDGFVRGAANKGWADSKMFVIEFSTPPPDGTDNTPAIWALPGQVMRSAQYGCNCRDEGGQGGCGEFDIFEVLQAGNHNQGISEIYSFKGATGTGSNNFFARPTSRSEIYTVLFDVATDQIAVSRSNSFNWNGKSLPRSTINAYLNAPAMVIPFNG